MRSEALAGLMLRIARLIPLRSGHSAAGSTAPDEERFFKRHVFGYDVVRCALAARSREDWTLSTTTLPGRPPARRPPGLRRPAPRPRTSSNSSSTPWKRTRRGDPGDRPQGQDLHRRCDGGVLGPFARHVGALADYLMKALKEAGVGQVRVEGLRPATGSSSMRATSSSTSSGPRSALLQSREEVVAARPGDRLAADIIG